ncbi:hypothetical protein EAG_02525 [Camponotus floridanus]|uniref:Uncharacterized protein n=2 Tax=Camponotus floridanus TaxID=104421 RepID=E2A6Y6_CAMFO|nr:hypothetical protein EAG_02525 [Camponotus floridanus]
METTINEIIPMSDNAIGITNYLYREILFTSQKQKLKINMKLGRIFDMDTFKYTLGTD